MEGGSARASVLMEIEEGLTPSVRTDLTGAAGLRAVPPGGRTKRLPRGPASASRVPRGPVPRVGPPWDARHPGGSRRSSRGRRSGRGAAGALPPAWPNRSSGCRQPLLALARGGAGGLWVFGVKKKKEEGNGESSPGRETAWKYWLCFPLSSTCASFFGYAGCSSLVSEPRTELRI